MELSKEVEPSLIPWWAVLRLDVLMKLPSERCHNFHWNRGIPNSPCNSHLQLAKEYNEIAVGGCCRNEKLQQYLENDRRVLRFHTFWDESGKYGSRKFPGLDCVAVDVLPSKKLWVLDPLTWIAQKISTSHWFLCSFFLEPQPQSASGQVLHLALLFGRWHCGNARKSAEDRAKDQTKTS